MVACFILADDGRSLPASFDEWAAWYARARRHVGHTIISADANRICLSTSFAGIAVSDTPPQFFSTLAYGISCERPVYWRTSYADAAAAMAGHRRAVDGWLWFFGHTLALQPRTHDLAADYHAIAQRAP